MAIFKCVAYFYFHMPEEFCFAVFLSSFNEGRKEGGKTGRPHEKHKHKCKRAECDQMGGGGRAKKAAKQNPSGI
jgi:hypothetical protein